MARNIMLDEALRKDLSDMFAYKLDMYVSIEGELVHADYIDRSNFHLDSFGETQSGDAWLVFSINKDYYKVSGWIDSFTEYPGFDYIERVIPQEKTTRVWREV